MQNGWAQSKGTTSPGMGTQKDDSKMRGGKSDDMAERTRRRAALARTLAKMNKG